MPSMFRVSLKVCLSSFRLKSARLWRSFPPLWQRHPQLIPGRGEGRLGLLTETLSRLRVWSKSSIWEHHLSTPSWSRQDPLTSLAHVTLKTWENHRETGLMLLFGCVMASGDGRTRVRAALRLCNILKCLKARMQCNSPKRKPGWLTILQLIHKTFKHFASRPRIHVKVVKKAHKRKPYVSI